MKKRASVIYHDLFDYPLNKEELVRWECAQDFASSKKVVCKNGFYFLENRRELIKKRLKRIKISEIKQRIAARQANLIGNLRTVLFVGLTGAVAMGNAKTNSDIDLMIITKSDRLWLTRALVLFKLWLAGVPVRRFGSQNQKDKLCLNLWLDETALTWPKNDRNIYSAHEIGQIKPLLNKDMTYEKFLNCNRWVKTYWPKAIKFPNPEIFKGAVKRQKSFLETILFKFQYFYMRKKITKEIVTPHKAVFHPRNWGEIVIAKIGA